MLLGLASISMMFIGLTSAYLVRQGLDPGWRTIGMPPLLVVNTVILLASSLTMERARRSVRQPLGRPAVNRWLAATLLLGLLFLAGQLAAWRQLSAKGFYLSTTAHSAFFYLLTGLHGLHLLGGLLALAYLNVRLSRRSDLGPEGAFVSIRRQRAMEATALYWHFMDGLWVYLLLLLFAFR
jgi:cytochrome c oxidase subunit 3